MSIITLNNLSQEKAQDQNLAQELIEKFDLNSEGEKLASTAMLALVAQANLSDKPSQKDYVERLSGFFAKYQDLVQELLDRAKETP